MPEARCSSGMPTVPATHPSPMAASDGTIISWMISLTGIPWSRNASTSVRAVRSSPPTSACSRRAAWLSQRRGSRPLRHPAGLGAAAGHLVHLADVDPVATPDPPGGQGAVANPLVRSLVVHTESLGRAHQIEILRVRLLAAGHTRTVAGCGTRRTATRSMRTIDGADFEECADPGMAGASAGLELNVTK